MKPGGSRRPFWVRFLSAIPLLLTASLLPAASPTEYDVKLAYLYNFTKFISWPDSKFAAPDAPLNICVVGKLPETETTNSLTQRKTRNHPIAVLHLEHPADAPCHILFLTRSASQRQLMAALQTAGPATLLVGETRDFARDTGIIGFVTDERHRIRIEVNLEKARQQDLNIRAQLLEIARKVYRDEEKS